MDKDNKIIELKTPIPERRLQLKTQKEANESGNDNWFDVRGLGLTAANEEAVRRNADWILKSDTDQVCYNDIIKLRPFLENANFNGLTFYQYEFSGDIGLDNYLSNPGPDSAYNDSVFTYKAIRGQFYGGGGAPALGLPGADRQEFPLIHCAHLRGCNPIFLTEDEKLEHFYGRNWFSLYTNKYGKFGSELNEAAMKDAKARLQYPNGIKTDIRPPEICMYDLR